MFGYEILRNKWVILMLFGGLALLFYVLVFYNDYHKSRKKRSDDPEKFETEYMGAWEAIPWSIKVTVAGIVIFALVYSIHAIIYPNSF